MVDEVDSRFRQHKKGASRRRRRAGAKRLSVWAGVPLVVLTAAGVGLWLTWEQWCFGPSCVSEADLEEDFTLIDTEFEARTGGFTAAFVDLPGDPMVIRLEATDLSRTTSDLPAGGVPEARAPGSLVLVDDVMVSTEESFITTLPSSPEDFAFFQSLRNNPASTAEPTFPGRDVVDPDAPVATDLDGLEGGGWGETLDDGAAPLPGFEETRIENTTSVTFVRKQPERAPLSQDVFVRISADRSIAGLLAARGFSGQEEDAKAIAAAFDIDELKEGMVVALRGVPEPTPDDPEQTALVLKQVSIYDSETYFGTLARRRDGSLADGVDPWVVDELFDYAGDEQEEGTQEQSYRMLDAFYSTAIRNRVPSAVVGEAISLLSKAHDMDAFANPGDRMRLLYTPELGEDAASGQVLYVALTGEEVEIECFVHADKDGSYRCFGAKPEAGAGGGAGGMITPVKGVLTSRFGPRTHPVLKTVRIHAGVDWAAPTGTPIVAAFAGQVSFVGVAGGYGNMVRVAHAGGYETRYAHMSRFGTSRGAQVAAGEVIGYIGTTGLSTGPHLHFELRRSGEALDPLVAGGAVAALIAGGGSAAAAAAAPAGAIMTGPASAAVETLVNQIIKVESAGNARAKNPLSTATGLGQFIESTWLRMMRTYRPDLVASLSRRELLDLRFDPTISRAMVTNLAREGESYLRARGHQITAGRLYLCHFLGAVGAHKVLSSSDEASLVSVLGQGVINANPFLRGKNVAYIKAWAERKMSGRKGRVTITNAPAPAPVIREPEGLPAYREAIRTVLGIS